MRKRGSGGLRIVGALVALALVASLPGVGSADDEGHPLQVLYAGAPPGPEAAARVAEALAEIDPPVSLVEPPTHVSDLFPAEEEALLGAAKVTPCAGEPAAVEDYLAGIADLQQAIRGLEDVGPRIRSLQAMQACLVEAAAPADLARVALLAGVVAHSDGDLSGATTAFAEVFAIDPTHPWDPEFPPDPQIQFANAATAVAQAPRFELSAVLPLGTSLWVDGRRIESPADPIELPPGRHLIHVRTLGAAAPTALAFTADGTADEVVLVHPGAFRADAALEGGLVASVERVLRGLDREGASRTPGHLVVLSPEPAVWSWEPSSRTLVAAARAPAETPEVPPVDPVPVEAPPLRRAAGGGSPAGPILFATGLGLAAGGGVMAFLSDRELDRLETSVADGAPFPGEGETCNDVEGEARDNCLDWERATDRLYVGYGLLAGGGALVAISIPVGISTAVGRRQALLTIQLQGPPPEAAGASDGPAIRGVHLSLTLW